MIAFIYIPSICKPVHNCKKKKVEKKADLTRELIHKKHTGFVFCYNKLECRIITIETIHSCVCDFCKTKLRYINL